MNPTPLARFRWPLLALPHARVELSRHCVRRRAMHALACGFLAMLLANVALAMLAESSLWIRDPIYADRQNRLSRIERALLPGSPVPMFLGTSRVGNGFDAKRSGERLSQVLARPAAAFNFGVAASGPILHRVYLARLLAEGHRPPLLLIEVLPASVADLPNGPLEALFVDGSRFVHAELDTLAAYGMPRSQLHHKWRETMISPWFALRFPLLGRLFPSARQPHLRHDEGRTADEHGWHRIMQEVLTPQSFALARERTLRDYTAILNDWHPSEAAGHALRDTLALAQTHHIPVALVLMPEASWFRELYSPAARKRFDRWIRALSRDCACPLIDARTWVPDEQFADGHHLLPGGAANFTDRLTDEVLLPHLKALPGGRP